ncbi:MAG TPA: VWA domain-containing protein [Thermoanaerobaculia bacterium]|nr:VWA domain-containing protein [Thermoanaerobaculia bacterium]
MKLRHTTTALLSLLLLAGLCPLTAQTAKPPAAPAPAAAAPRTSPPASPAKSPTAPPAAAKSPAAATAGGEGAFVENVDVSVVNVDVYVTEKKGGRRVTGLTRDDFEILEDGKPMAITNFYAIEGGRPLTASAQPEEQLPGAPPPERVGGPAPVPEDQRLRLIVYLDNYNIHPFNRNRVLRELRGFIHDHVSRQDQLMLVTYDRELHIRRTFTSDSDLIAAALLEQETVTGSAVHADSDRRSVLDRIDESQNATEAVGYARLYAESVFNDLSFTITAIKKMVDAMAGMPGRKAVLYVSDGLPMIAGQDVFYAVQNKYPENSGSMNEAIQYDASRRFKELGSQANANRVTFYTIDAAGLRTFSSVSAENGKAGSPGQGIYVDSVDVSNLQAPLQMLAEDTGGISVINTNNIEPDLGRIAADFNTYYSLGYTPAHIGDGRYHKIDVRIKKRGYVLRHRDGYRDKSTESQMSDGTLAALQFPYEQNPLHIGLDFGHGSQREDGFFLVPVQVKIPLGKLVLIPRQASQDASVRFFVAAMDSDGNTSDVQQARVPISIPNGEVATARDKYYVYTVSLLMRPGEHRVAVGVRDDAASAASFIARGVHVGG